MCIRDRYSDVEVGNLEDHTAWQIFSDFFTPAGNEYFSSMSMSALVALFVGVGSAIAFVTKSYVAIPVIIIGFSFFNMMTKSYGFFSKLFTNWDNTQLTYLGICLGTLLIVVTVITIVEMAAHGRSG